MLITWDKLSLLPDDLPILGYQLFMRATNDKEDAKMIYDGSNNPDTT